MNLEPDNIEPTPELTSGQVALAALEHRGISLRCIFIGAFFSLALSVIIPYNLNVIRGSYLAMDHNAPGAIALFFLAVAGMNLLLRLIGHAPRKRLVRGELLEGMDRFRAALPLGRGELLTIYVMLVISSALASLGLATQLPPIIVAPFYFATEVNQWGELFGPHLPRWLVVSDPEAVRTFYEGIPDQGGFWKDLVAMPWQAWALPMACWAIFLFALYWVMICIAVIVRKQWIEKEILPYPLVKLPLELVETDTEKPTLLPALFSNRLLWIGFTIPAFLSSMRAINVYFPNFPFVITYPAWSTEIFSGLLLLMFFISFSAVGFAFLINLDVSFSIWFFGLLGVLISGAMAYFGWTARFQENLGIYGSSNNPLLYHFGMGALFAMVFYGLWIARAHLGDVFGKAFGRRDQVDDSNEILSYRVAVFGLLVGFVVMVGWLYLSGMPIWLAIVFLMVALAIFYALSRVVVEGGLAAVVAPGITPPISTSAFGASAIGAGGLVSMALTYVWCADVRTFVMAPACNGLKAVEGVGKNRRWLIWAILLAMAITFIFSVGTVIYQAYQFGAINMNRWFFRDGPKAPYEYFAEVMRTDSAPNTTGWLAMLIGVAVMLGLTAVRHRVVRWPLHPIGLIVMGIWLMATLWFSFFLAWLIKMLLVRYGGPRLYAKAVPFFYGLILGQFVSCGVWVAIDYFTGMTDNSLFWL